MIITGDGDTVVPVQASDAPWLARRHGRHLPLHMHRTHRAGVLAVVIIPPRQTTYTSVKEPY